MAHTVFIRGIPDNPSVIDVRVRMTPGIEGVVLFRALLNTTATAHAIVLDPQNANFQGQVYRWFDLKFTDGRTGWVRDDLLDLQGDLTELGYQNYPRRIFAFVASQSVPADKIKKLASGRSIEPVEPEKPEPRKPDTDSTVPVEPVQTPICKGNARSDVQPNLRSAPTIKGSPVSRLQPNDPVSIYGVEPGQDGDGFRWVKVEFKGLLGYVREDLLVYQDECKAIQLPKPKSLTPTQLKIPSITLNSSKFGVPFASNNFLITQEFGLSGHKGTDFGFSVGTPVIANGNGTAFVLRCRRCRDDAPNFRSQGVNDNDRNSLNDPLWGYGYGNMVIVRYPWEALPDAMRAVMTQRGLSNGFVYALHAHLSSVNVSDGQSVSSGTVIGLSGNTGNSTGPHLHLELRLSANGAPSRIEDLFNRVVENARSMYQF